MHGYSEGAMVVVASMSQSPFQLPEAPIPTPIQALISNRQRKEVDQQIVAVTLFGDPYYQSGQPQNRGPPSGQGVGIIKEVLTFANTKVPARLVTRTRDYCRPKDPVCAGLGLSLFMDGFNDHHYVNTTEESEAIAFVISMLRK